MRHDDTMRQGATFYRVVEVFANSQLTIEQIRAMTPRATLLGTTTAFLCAWLGDVTKAEIAVSMSRDVTATLDHSRPYEYNLDVYDGTVTHEVLNGKLTVREGQKPL